MFSLRSQDRCSAGGFGFSCLGLKGYAVKDFGDCRSLWPSTSAFGFPFSAMGDSWRHRFNFGAG